MIDDNWLSQNRHLRLSYLERTREFEVKEKMLSDIFKIASETSISSFEPVIIDSHEGVIQALTEHNQIMCDTHFVDYATLLSAAFYSAEPLHDIKRIANAMLADSMIRSDDIEYALHFARQYINGPIVSMFSAAAHEEYRNTVFSSRTLQAFFAIRHELAHFDFHSKTTIWEQIFAGLKELLSVAIHDHNKVAETVNSIDLRPLQPEITIIREEILPVLDGPTTPETSLRLKQTWKSISNLVSDRAEVLDSIGYSDEENRLLLFYACDNYIRNKKSAVLDEIDFVEECMCDLLALLELLDLGVNTMEKKQAHKCSIEAYTLCLLTQNMLRTARDIQIINSKDHNEPVDNVYLRLHFESALMPEFLVIASFLWDDSSMQTDIPLLLDVFKQAKMRCELMYAEFCEYILFLTFDDIDEKYIPMSDPRWKYYYSETERLMRFPV